MPLGTLEVVLVEARGLKKTDFLCNFLSLPLYLYVMNLEFFTLISVGNFMYVMKYEFWVAWLFSDLLSVDLNSLLLRSAELNVVNFKV